MLRLDTATASDQGQRAYQEDSLVSDFPQGAPFGFAVVADGMGGHAAGDRASQIAIHSAFDELRRLRNNHCEDTEFPTHLKDIVQGANAKIQRYSADHPETSGMGTTFVATVISDDKLFWASVGDSPLYLYRDGALQQVNQDHSLAPQIDLLVASGMLSPEDGRDHPDRNVLTSVLVGSDIPKIDCPEQATTLAEGDILVIASDGLQTLDHAQLEETLHKNRFRPSSDIIDRLITDLKSANDPDQDNASAIVIRILPKSETRQPALLRRSSVRQAPPKLTAFFRTHFHLTTKRRSSTQ